MRHAYVGIEAVLEARRRSAAAVFALGFSLAYSTFSICRVINGTERGVVAAVEIGQRGLSDSVMVLTKWEDSLPSELRDLAREHFEIAPQSKSIAEAMHAKDFAMSAAERWFANINADAEH